MQYCLKYVDVETGEVTYGVFSYSEEVAMQLTIAQRAVTNAYRTLVYCVPITEREGAPGTDVPVYVPSELLHSGVGEDEPFVLLDNGTREYESDPPGGGIPIDVVIGAFFGICPPRDIRELDSEWMAMCGFFVRGWRAHEAWLKDNKAPDSG